MSVGIEPWSTEQPSNRPRFIDVWVMDSSYSLGTKENIATAIAQIVSKGEIDISSVKDMVGKVSAVCIVNAARIRKLVISGHGGRKGFTIGADIIGMPNIHQYQVDLQKLNSFLDNTCSVVCLDHCNTGQNQELLQLLSNMWGGVEIRAFEGIQSAWNDQTIDSTFEGEGPVAICKFSNCRVNRN